MVLVLADLWVETPVHSCSPSTNTTGYVLGWIPDFMGRERDYGTTRTRGCAVVSRRGFQPRMQPDRQSREPSRSRLARWTEILQLRRARRTVLRGWKPRLLTTARRRRYSLSDVA